MLASLTVIFSVTVNFVLKIRDDNKIGQYLASRSDIYMYKITVTVDDIFSLKIISILIFTLFPKLHRVRKKRRHFIFASNSAKC